MNTKLATIALILCLTGTSCVYASYKLYSNTLTDTVTEYVLGTLTADSNTGLRYSNVTFNGRLLMGTDGVPGKTVSLYRSPDNVTFTKIVDTTTNSFGYYTFEVNRTETGVFYYKAGFDTP